MKETKLFKLWFMLLLIAIGVANAWGQEVVHYTLDAQTNSVNNSYSNYYDVTINDMQWNAPGNQSFSGYWSLGGKSINGVERTITGKSAMNCAITKVRIAHDGRTNTSLTLNNAKLIVSSDAAFTTIIDEVILTPQVNSASTFTFTPGLNGTEWPSGSFYKIIFNVTNTKTTNYGLKFKSATFFKKEGSSTDPNTLSAPNGLTVDNITTNSARLQWNSVVNADGYTLRIGETEISNVTSPYIASGLVENTQYTWTVKAISNGTYNSSEYASNSTFRTLPITYNVTVNNCPGGAIKASKTTAAAGGKIYLTPIPNSKYYLESWNVITTAGDPITVADDDTFIMPASDVTVSATFREGAHYELVTSTSQLTIGSKYVIATKFFDGQSTAPEGVFMSTEEYPNHRKETKYKYKFDDVTVGIPADALILKLGRGSNNSYTFQTVNYEGANGYLNATDVTNANRLIVSQDNDNYKDFNINFQNKVALITCAGKTRYNLIRYNTTTCFACYDNGENPVYLYKEVTDDDFEAPIFAPGAGTYTQAQNVKVSNYNENLFYVYTIDGSTPDYDNACTENGTSYFYYNDSGIDITATSTLKMIACYFNATADLIESTITSATYTINIPTPTLRLNPTSVDFGSVETGSEIEAKNVTATLTNTSRATVKLSGDGASAFAISPETLSGSGNITITPNTSIEGDYTATLTVSADGAESATATITMKVEAPEPPEKTPASFKYTVHAKVGSQFQGLTFSNNLGAAAIYSSSDDSIATVDPQSGKVTVGNTVGEVTITYTVVGTSEVKTATQTYTIVVE